MVMRRRSLTAELRIRAVGALPVPAARLLGEPWVRPKPARVWLDGEDSDRWHSTFGGGIMGILHRHLYLDLLGGPERRGYPIPLRRRCFISEEGQIDYG